MTQSERAAYLVTMIRIAYERGYKDPFKWALRVRALAFPKSE